MSKPVPLSVTVSPYKVTAYTRQFSVPVTVRDSGTGALRVSGSFRQLASTPKGCHQIAPPSWAKVTPASFTLQPGQVEHATVTVAAPQAAHGSYDLAAIFAALPATAPQGVTVSDGVGTRVLINLGGTNDSHPCLVAAPPHRIAASPSSGTSVPYAGIGAALVLLVLLAIAVVLVRHRRRQAGGR